MPPHPWMNISSKPRLLGQRSGSSPRCHLPKMPVVYPAAFSTCASVVALGVSRSRSRIVCVTPFLNSCRPVRSADRVGEHVGLTWKSVNRTPSAWSLSRFGVLRTGLPWAETSPYPWSSVSTKTMFGFLPASGSAAVAPPRDAPNRTASAVRDRITGTPPGCGESRHFTPSADLRLVLAGQLAAVRGFTSCRDRTRRRGRPRGPPTRCGTSPGCRGPGGTPGRSSSSSAGP